MYSTPATTAAKPPQRIRFEDDMESSPLTRTLPRRMMTRIETRGIPKQTIFTIEL